MPEGRLAFGDAHPIAAAIREHLGVGPYDEVRTHTPQFERVDGQLITFIPRSRSDWDAVKAAPRDILLSLECCVWDESGLLLFPGEWYPYIPQGMKIRTINYEDKVFALGKTDNDIRFGCLAYGLVKK